MPTLNRLNSIGNKTVNKQLSAPAAWTPASLSGLVAWFDPSYGVYSDDGVTSAVVDDPIYNWTPRNYSTSTTICKQTTLSNRPLLKKGSNDKYYLSFNGSNHKMISTFTDSFARDITVAVQWRSDLLGTTPVYPSIISKNHISYLAGWLICYNNNTRKFGATSPYAATIANEATNSDDATWYRGAMTVTSSATATYTIYKNGSSVASASDANGQHSAGDKFCIGVDAETGTGHWKGKIGHIVLVNGVLSSGDLSLLDTFLTTEMPT